MSKWTFKEQSRGKFAVAYLISHEWEGNWGWFSCLCCGERCKFHGAFNDAVVVHLKTKHFHIFFEHLLLGNIYVER